MTNGWRCIQSGIFDMKDSVCVELLQSCLTLCDLMDSSQPTSSVHGILQARILEWVAVPTSRGSSQPRHRHLLIFLHWRPGSLPLMLSKSDPWSPWKTADTSNSPCQKTQVGRWMFHFPTISQPRDWGRQPNYSQYMSEETCLPACVLSHVRLFVTPWTLAHQAPLSMEFSRQEYWSGLLNPPPGDLPGPGIKATCPVSLALAGGFFTTVPPSSALTEHFLSCRYSFNLD